VLLVEDSSRIARAIRDGLHLEAIVPGHRRQRLKLLSVTAYGIAVLDTCPGPSGDG
jgi:hypothetical protein